MFADKLVYVLILFTADACDAADVFINKITYKLIETSLNYCKLVSIRESFGDG